MPHEQTLGIPRCRFLRRPRDLSRATWEAPTKNEGMPRPTNPRTPSFRSFENWEKALSRANKSAVTWRQTRKTNTDLDVCQDKGTPRKKIGFLLDSFNTNTKKMPSETDTPLYFARKSFKAPLLKFVDRACVLFNHEPHLRDTRALASQTRAHGIWDLPKAGVRQTGTFLHVSRTRPKS